jgi:hypothetical protein
MPPVQTPSLTKPAFPDCQNHNHHHLRTIKAPFRVTQMGDSWLWLWSRRGRYWVIEQGLLPGIAQHKPVGLRRGN